MDGAARKWQSFQFNLETIIIADLQKENHSLKTQVVDLEREVKSKQKIINPYQQQEVLIREQIPFESKFVVSLEISLEMIQQTLKAQLSEEKEHMHGMAL